MAFLKTWDFSPKDLKKFFICVLFWSMSQKVVLTKCEFVFSRLNNEFWRLRVCFNFVFSLKLRYVEIAVPKFVMGKYVTQLEDTKILNKL